MAVVLRADYISSQGLRTNVAGPIWQIRAAPSVAACLCAQGAPGLK